MTTIHTELPRHEGEKRLANRLRQLDERFHVWFSVDSVPKVADIDLIIVDENAGVFIVEVKAIPLNMIESFGYSSCSIRGRGNGRSPQAQATEARDALMSFLKSKGTRTPFMIATACFPLIRRDEWNQRWSTDQHSRFAGAFSESIIFEDDLIGGSDVLTERLRKIWFAPPTKNGANDHYKHSPSFPRELTDLLVAQANMPAAPSDLEKLRKIEGREAADAVKDAPYDQKTELAYVGYPGTGKTFRLLQIGVAHALKGKRVLFTCFNKVLASDIARMLKPARVYKDDNLELRTADIFDLLRSYSRTRGVEVGDLDHNEWGQLIVDELRNDPDDVTKFDLILVDEAQDFQQWQFELLDLHRHDQTSVIIATGRGQELYANESVWLRDFLKLHPPKNLRRNFRNTMPVFRLAFVLHQSKLRPEGFEAAAKKLRDIGKTDQGLLFERKEGGLPEIRIIDDSKLNYESTFIAIEQEELMVGEYTSLIKDTLGDLADRARPIDVLILVPSEKSLEHQRLLSALKASKLDYIDYTVDANRRTVASPQQLRVCTFHSSRGIEGHRVLAFGAHTLGEVAKSAGIETANVVYVSLSRAVFEMILVEPKSVYRKGLMPVFTEAIGVLRNRM
jgi:hypothetical protein